MKHPFLQTERFFLRLGEKEDIPAILDYFERNRAHLVPFEPRRPDDFYDPVFWHRRIRINRLEFRTERSCRLFLFKREEPERIIGTISLTNFQRGVKHSCALGYGLDVAEQGKGAMFEALNEAVRYAFEELRFHRIEAQYMPTNERSGKLLRRLGFSVEGYARDYIQINGCWVDHVMTALHNPNWN